MNLDLNKIQKIASLNKDYRDKVLKERYLKKNNYLKDPKEALFFIFSFAFFQGRKDVLSEKFKRNTEKLFSSIKLNLTGRSKGYYDKTGKKKKEIGERFRQDPEYKEIYQILESEKTGKEADRLMVLGLIDFAREVGGNIVKYLKEEIEKGNLKKAYNELLKIYSIGPKIASLILRDIVYIYKLEPHLKVKEDYYFIQPVDTWVEKVSKRVKLLPEKDEYIDKKLKIKARKLNVSEKSIIIVDNLRDDAEKFKVNPIHYNQGAWYLGARAFEFVLENLEKII